VEDFINFFNEKNKGQWTLEIYYLSIMDWCLTIGYKKTHPKYGEQLILLQDSDLDYVFAKAQVLFKDWLMENEGGY
jgi:hypothetical protein